MLLLFRISITIFYSFYKVIYSLSTSKYFFFIQLFRNLFLFPEKKKDKEIIIIINNN